MVSAPAGAAGLRRIHAHAPTLTKTNKRTPGPLQTAFADIPGTPTIFINGEQLQTTNALLYQVCNAYTGTKPAGCP